MNPRSDISWYRGNQYTIDDIMNKRHLQESINFDGFKNNEELQKYFQELNDLPDEITLDGKKIDYSVTDKIGFLTEERSLLPKLTVKEQLLFYGALKNMSDEEILKRSEVLLERFGIKDYLNRKIKELSKGNQQKVQFISAIINEPELLILDEPFSGLDPFNVELFKAEIESMSKKGSIIIFSSHRMEHVELFCKKIAIILKGKTVLEGDLKEIKEKYRKKNIIVKGTIDVDKIKKIKGVIDVTLNNLEYQIKIDDISVSDLVFKEIIKDVIEEPSLNEIFVSKVGESYEK